MNVVEHVEQGAARHPRRPAVVFEGESLDYGALNTNAAMLASALQQSGVERGDRVALYLPNVPAFALVYLATLGIGAIAVSVNSILKAEEVKYILTDSGAKVVFTVAELLPNIPRSDCPTVRHVVNCEGVAPGETLADWLARGADKPAALVQMKPDDPCAILYSSGTTGFPKGVTLSHNNVQTNIRACAEGSGFRADDRYACFLPLFHVFAQNFIMNACFEVGGTLVLWRRYVPDRVLEGIERERVTMFFAVPTIYIGLLNANVPREKLRSIRYYFSAASTMPEEISRAWADRYGISVHEGYGLTECSPCATYNHVSRHKFGSVGTAITDFEIRIAGENDREMERGKWGEILIRGPGVMLGYWNNPQETQHALRGGWLHSGDIGRMDEEDYVYIVDRVKDMINVSGFKVWPAEVENYLYRIRGIREVAVYGVPDAQKGEAVRAAVVLNEGANVSAEEIIAWCKEHLAAYKAPSRVDFVRELPKSATGKILKRVLREQAGDS